MNVTVQNSNTSVVECCVPKPWSTGIRLFVRSTNSISRMRVSVQKPKGSEQMQMNFVTIFTRFKNVHFLKDLGQIPYHMHKDHGCNSIIVTNRNDRNYEGLEKEVKGLKLHFIKGRGIAYVMRYAKKIDVLNVYHLNLQSFYLLLIFKLLKKPGAKAYLKLDMDDRGFDRLFMKNPVGWIKRRTMDLADVVSAETRDIYKKLKKVYGGKMIFVTNGYYSLHTGPERRFNKKNEVLTVGLLGTEPKATDVLIKAFVKAAGDRDDWILRLVGPVDKTFVNPCPSDRRVIFEGEITDRAELTKIYEEAKIFAFPSRHESFGIVMLEAADGGDYIISTTGVPAARDIIDVTKEGEIVPVDDVDALADALIRAMSDEIDYNEKGVRIAGSVFENYEWTKIVNGLAEKLI